MRRLKSDSFIKPQGIYTFFIRRQLNQVASPFPSTLNSPTNELATDTFATFRRGNTNTFNGCSPTTLVCDMRGKCNLLDPHDTVPITGYNQFNVWI